MKKCKVEGVKALAEAEKARAAALATSDSLVKYKALDIEMILAEAQLEFARHYKGNTPHSVQIIGTDEAANMSTFIGLPSMVVDAGK